MLGNSLISSVCNAAEALSSGTLVVSTLNCGAFSRTPLGNTMEKLQKAIEELDTELKKAKYKSRRPDGKGGWLYDYGDGFKKRQQKNSPTHELSRRISQIESDVFGKKSVQTSYMQSFFDVSPQKFKKQAEDNGYNVVEDKKNDEMILIKKDKTFQNKSFKSGDISFKVIGKGKGKFQI